MISKFFYILFFASSILAFSSCEKSDDYCNCVDANGEEEQLTAEDQECSDLSTESLTCYPAD